MCMCDECRVFVDEMRCCPRNIPNYNEVVNVISIINVPVVVPTFHRVGIKSSYARHIGLGMMLVCNDNTFLG